MSAVVDTWSWLTTASHYGGRDGVPTRVGQHLEITLASVGLGAAVALPLGLVLGHLRRGGLLVVSVANAGRAIPTFGLLVLFAVGPFGIGLTSAIAALSVFSVPPMLTNAYTGMTGVDRDVVESARGMGMRERQLLLRVELPLALPLVAAGLRTATVQVIATATLAAYVGTGGLGRYIFDGYGRQDYALVYAGVVLVGLLAVLAEYGLGVLQRLLTPGRGRLSLRSRAERRPVAAGAG